MKVTVTEYRNSVQKQIIAFEDDWIENNKKDQKQYPLELSPADFDEMFKYWLEAHCGEDFQQEG